MNNLESRQYCWGRNVTNGVNDEISCRRAPVAEVEILRNGLMGFVQSGLTYCASCTGVLQSSHDISVLSINRLSKEDNERIQLGATTRKNEE